MSSKKSLGSSPIGFSGLSQNSYRFIRDLGVSKRSDADSGKKTQDGITRLHPVGSRREQSETAGAAFVEEKKKPEQRQPEKKIVSYYLEVNLIDRLKRVADRRGEYYSSVVSKALQHWIDQHNA